MSGRAQALADVGEGDGTVSFLQKSVGYVPWDTYPNVSRLYPEFGENLGYGVSAGKTHFSILRIPSIPRSRVKRYIDMYLKYTKGGLPA